MKNLLRNPKFIILVLLLIGICIVLANRQFRLDHPVLSFIFVWFSLPFYAAFAIKSRLTPVNTNPLVNQDKIDKVEPNYMDNMQEVSHIEQKTITTTKTEEAKIIYFNNYKE